MATKRKHAVLVISSDDEDDVPPAKQGSRAQKSKVILLSSFCVASKDALCPS